MRRRPALRPGGLHSHATALVLLLLVRPAAVAARGVTTEPSRIPMVDKVYPAGLFNWASGASCSPGIDHCGTLDFCQEGNTYGYAIPGHQCQPFNGPTIKLVAGRRYMLTLRNTAEQGTWTNLHTHGLHIVGTGSSDDVTRSVAPGGCLDYVWELPPDHPGGTNWYHSHMHGNSARQVGGGAFGLLIVEDNPTINPRNLAPAWADYERVLQIFRSAEVGYLSNGQASYDVEVERRRWFRLRVSVVDPLAVADRFTIEGCQYMKVAHDGIWSSSVPQPERPYHILTGSSRADFVVRCDGTGSFPIRYGGKTVGRIVPGTETSQEIALTYWTPTRPASLTGLREAFVPSTNVFNVLMSEVGINGITWNPEVPLHTIAFNEVHEWTIHRSNIHAFHKHMYHVQIVSPGGCGEMHQEGEIYDTISGADFQGVCRIRFRTSDFGQREILHCHVLEHSDQGAMGWVNVVGPNMPTNNFFLPPYQCNAPVNGGSSSPNENENVNVPAGPQPVDPFPISLIVANYMYETVMLFYQAVDGTLVPQGPLNGRSFYEMKTHVGARYFWALAPGQPLQLLFVPTDAGDTPYGEAKIEQAGTTLNFKSTPWTYYAS